MSFVLPMGFFLVGGVCSGVAQQERRDTGVRQSVVPDGMGAIALAAFGKRPRPFWTLIRWVSHAVGRASVCRAVMVWLDETRRDADADADADKMG